MKTQMMMSTFKLAILDKVFNISFTGQVAAARVLLNVN